MVELSSALIASVIFILWAGTDVWFYDSSGDDATYSKSMLRLTANHRALILTLPYTFGVAAMHFTNPTFAAPRSLPVTILYAVIACLPMIYTLGVMIRSQYASDLQVYNSYRYANRLLILTIATVAFVVGGAAGMFLVPQHLAVST